MTASELAWEAFKGLGSAAGFWSTGYVLWDRYWKHVPLALVVARPLMEGSRQIVPRLAVSNLSQRPILISWENAPGEMRVAMDDSTVSMIATMWPRRRTAAVDAGQTREFILLNPSDFKSLPSHAPLSVTLKWKFAQPILWQPERRIRVWLKKQDLQSLLGETDDIDDE